MFKLPKIVDLFSGCGGLALGFEKAGFDIVAGIELVLIIYVGVMGEEKLIYVEI